jgi:hypothetical protein
MAFKGLRKNNLAELTPRFESDLAQIWPGRLSLFELRNITEAHKIYEVRAEEE